MLLGRHLEKVDACEGAGMLEGRFLLHAGVGGVKVKPQGVWVFVVQFACDLVLEVLAEWLFFHCHSHQLIKFLEKVFSIQVSQAMCGWLLTLSRVRLLLCDLRTLDGSLMSTILTRIIQIEHYS